MRRRLVGRAWAWPPSRCPSRRRASRADPSPSAASPTGATGTSVQPRISGHVQEQSSPRIRCAAVGGDRVGGAGERGRRAPGHGRSGQLDTVGTGIAVLSSSSDVGYRDAPCVGTHNSFNSTAEVGSTLSAEDSNQQIRIVDQLELGVRSIELDVHWFLRPGAGARAVVVCHGRGDSEAHAACTTEPTVDLVLDPIVAWLREPAHRNEVINVHLQDELESAEGYDAAAAILQQKLGTLLYAPPAPAPGSCAPLPLDLSRDDVRAAVRPGGPGQRLRARQRLAGRRLHLDRGPRGGAAAGLPGLSRVRSGGGPGPPTRRR